MSSTTKTILVIIGLIIIAAMLYGLSDLLSTKSNNGNASLPELQEINYSQYKGKPLFVVFFGSWCGPCREEAPTIESMYKQYRDRINFLAIAVNDNSDNVQSFANEKNLTYPMAVGSNELVTEYQISGVPTMLFIDANGKTVEKQTGALDAETLKQKLENLL